MGIKGIYHEIGPGERISLQKLAVETYEAKGRPLRLAIDISIWLFQMQSGKGGTNPALRTFYYRLLRLISFSIHPLFVFDGPNKPPFKRDKRTGPNVASIPDFLAKQLLKKFAIPFHVAPGEAEAECASLQQNGVVDAVLSEDVDTLMFGCGRTLRTWSAEPGTGTQTRTHVNLYDAEKTKAGKSGLDRPGMILVAMMSGGDYLPEGIPGCGPKTACEAARAGFGADLCSLARRDRPGIAAWKTRLCHELKTNESKHFSRKHKALVVPEEFPRMDILGYYTMPVISTDAQVEEIRRRIAWDQPLDVDGLRSFCGEAFDWVCISGAKKFIRNIAPCMLVKELRLKAEHSASSRLEAIKKSEGQLVRGIHGKRYHKSTDGSPELRVSFSPIELVKIDLEAEDPDPEIATGDSDVDEDEAGITEAMDEPTSPKKRAPSKYDPTQTEKVWLLQTFVKVGVPLTAEDYEETCRRNDAAKIAKEAAKASRQAVRSATDSLTTSQKSTAPGGMQRGALDRFTRVTKPGNLSSQIFSHAKTNQITLDDPFEETCHAIEFSDPMAKRLEPMVPMSRSSGIEHETSDATTLPAPAFIDLLSSPEQTSIREKRGLQRTLSETDSANSEVLSLCHRDSMSSTREIGFSPHLPASVNTRRPRSPLRRTQTMSDSLSEELAPLREQFSQHHHHHTQNLSRHNLSTKQPSRNPGSPRRRQPSEKWDSSKPSAEIINISSSPISTCSPTKQRSITDWAHPNQNHINERPIAEVTTLDLSDVYDDGEISVLKLKGPVLPTAQLTRPYGGETINSLSDSRTTQKRTVRIRESLEGSWVFEAHKDSQATPEAKRNKSRRRLFQLNPVAILDMTDDD